MVVHDTLGRKNSDPVVKTWQARATLAVIHWAAYTQATRGTADFTTGITAERTEKIAVFWAVPTFLTEIQNTRRPSNRFWRCRVSQLEPDDIPSCCATLIRTETTHATWLSHGFHLNELNTQMSSSWHDHWLRLRSTTRLQSSKSFKIINFLQLSCLTRVTPPRFQRIYVQNCSNKNRSPGTDLNILKPVW